MEQRKVFYYWLNPVESPKMGGFGPGRGGMCVAFGRGVTGFVRWGGFLRPKKGVKKLGSFVKYEEFLIAFFWGLKGPSPFQNKI
jgi:hypothetical protein